MSNKKTHEQYVAEIAAINPKPVDFFGEQEGYEGTIKRDGIKGSYCKYNDITLVTIPYYANLYEELEKMYELFIVKEVVA